MADKIITIRKNSILQHGPFNDRIYLIRLDEDDFPAIFEDLEVLRKKYNYSKIIAKIPPFAVSAFLSEGYTLEARVPFFYDGVYEAAFMGKSFSPERQKENRWKKVERNICLALTKQQEVFNPVLPKNSIMRPVVEEDAEQMAELYRRVFETYPFPIHDPAYLHKTMRENIRYLGIWRKEKLVALSSAEQDVKERNAEMTDFATDPAYRSKGFASLLLNAMEEMMEQTGYKTLYTIARAMSPGMNITFARAGYSIGGTLIKNTNIFGQFESMNVWFKRLF